MPTVIFQSIISVPICYDLVVASDVCWKQIYYSILFYSILFYMENIIETKQYGSNIWIVILGPIILKQTPNTFF